MGYQAIPMGCGGGKEEKTDAPQGEWVDHWAKLAFHVEKKTKPKKIIAAINEMLNTVDRGCEEKMQIEALVPLWTPDYSAFDAEKKLVKQLKHSTNSEGEPYDARKQEPIRIIGIDHEQFDPEVWNQHLDFGSEEFKTYEATFGDGFDGSSDDSSGDELDIEVGLRIKFWVAKEPEPEPEPEPYVPSDHWYKLEFEVDKKCKPKKIIAAVNKLLEEHGMQVEQLVPLWTPDYTALEGGKKLVKQLKHSQKGDDEDYDARKEDPVRLIAVDMEQFDANVWNEHLNFGGDEFEKHEISFEDLEDSDASDSSSDSNLTIQVGIRVIY